MLDDLQQTVLAESDLVLEHSIEQSTRPQPAGVEKVHRQSAGIATGERHEGGGEDPLRMIAAIELGSLEPDRTNRLVHRPRHAKSLRPGKRADTCAQLDIPEGAVVAVARLRSVLG